MDQSHFGISDYVALISQAKRVYRQARDSNSVYRELQQDVLNLRNHLENVEDHINSGKMSFSMLPMLFEVGECCRETLTRLEAELVDNDGNLALNRLTLDAEGGHKNEYEDIQSHLIQDIEAVTLFYRSMVSDSQFKLSGSLEQLVKDCRSGRHQNLSESTLKCAVNSVQDEENEQAWHALTKRLEELGVDTSTIADNRNFISTWIRSSIERNKNRISVSSRSSTLLGSPLLRSKSDAKSVNSSDPKSSGSHTQSPPLTSLLAPIFKERSCTDQLDQPDEPQGVDRSSPQVKTGFTEESSTSLINTVTSDRPDSILVPSRTISSDSTQRNIFHITETASTPQDRQDSLPTVEPLRVHSRTTSASYAYPNQQGTPDILDNLGSNTRSNPSHSATFSRDFNLALLEAHEIDSVPPTSGISVENPDEIPPSYSESLSEPISNGGRQSISNAAIQASESAFQANQHSREHVPSSPPSRYGYLPFEYTSNGSSAETTATGFSPSRNALPRPNYYSYPNTGSGVGPNLSRPSAESRARNIANEPVSDKEPLSSLKSSQEVTDSMPEVWCNCWINIHEACKYLREHSWTAVERQIGLCMEDCRCGNLQNPKIVEELWFLRGACFSFEGNFLSAIQCFSPILLHSSYSTQHDPLLRLTALMWIGDASLCAGRPQACLVAWILALNSLESEILNSAHPTELKARILIPISERLKQEIVHFRGFKLVSDAWKTLTESSPWILALGNSSTECASAITKKLESLKSVRMAKNARSGSLKFGPSTLLKGRLSGALYGLIRIDVEHNTNHLLTWDPFFCVEGAARLCEIAKVPLESPLRYAPNPSTIKTKFGSTFSYSDFMVHKLPETFTAQLKDHLGKSNADYSWLESGDFVCSWPMKERMLPFAQCTFQVKVVKYKRTNTLGLQVDSNVYTSRVTLEYLKLKDKVTQELLSILKTLSDT